MERLVEALRGGNVILFVGGGVSMNLGLPEWKQLVGHMAEELGLDRNGFTSSAEYLVLAEYYQSIKGDLAPLIRWMDSTWHDSRIDVSNCDLYRLIVELAPPLIYTTNYDRWLEKAFEHYGRDYVSIVNVRDLTRVRDHATQIVKLHGDYRDPASIVLTESSYFDRLNFESPLDIKLRSESLSRTILFIGYSLSDINVRYLLYKLKRLWESSRCSESRPPSYIFLPRYDPVQEVVLKERGVVPIFSQATEPGEGLRDFLHRLLLQLRNR